MLQQPIAGYPGGYSGSDAQKRVSDLRVNQQKFALKVGQHSKIEYEKKRQKFFFERGKLRANVSRTLKLLRKGLRTVKIRKWFTMFREAVAVRQTFEEATTSGEIFTNGVSAVSVKISRS